MIEGRIPPQDKAIEDDLLSCMITIDSKRDEISSLNPELFYSDENKALFESIAALHKENKVIDSRTVINRCKQDGILDSVGGAIRIAKLASEIVIGNIDEYIMILKEKYMLRELIARAYGMMRNAYSDQFDESLDILDGMYEFINNQFSNSLSLVDSTSVLKQMVDDAVMRAENYENGIDNGLPIPIGKIQSKLGGWQKGNLVVIAARPSVGKTAFALFCIKHLIKTKKKVLIFSLEMDAKSIMTRLVLSDTSIDNIEFRVKGMQKSDAELVNSLVKEYSSYDIHIVDKPAVNVEFVRAISKKVKPDIVVVDYLQLMSFDSKKNMNKTDEVGVVTGRLKCLAKELDIPVLLLSQLNRNLEHRGGERKPMLSDLRSSGDIEQDADIVIFLHRAALYDNSPENKGRIDYIIAKNRDGDVGTIEGKHNKYVNDFADFDQDYPDYSWSDKRIEPVKEEHKQSDIPF